MEIWKHLNNASIFRKWPLGFKGKMVVYIWTFMKILQKDTSELVFTDNLMKSPHKKRFILRYVSLFQWTVGFVLIPINVSSIHF